MVIEWLRFTLAPENREVFIQLDTEIWTPFLQQAAGFVSKETWLDPLDDTAVIFVIRWASREQWKAISEAALVEVTQRFDTALGFPYEMSESTEFQVRRFAVTS